MAKIGIVLSQLDYRNETQPVIKSVPVSAQALTSSGTSQASSVVVPADPKGQVFWVITAADGPVWVKFGAAPVAAAGADHLIPAGATREFSAGAAGEKCAVIDA